MAAMFNSNPDKLLKRHKELVQSDGQKVLSHVQQPAGEWFLNTLMIEGYEVPFRYKRTQQYKSLRGSRVNLTYYPAVDKVAGIEFEVMKVVRIKLS